MIDEKARRIALEIAAEYTRARIIHPPMHSPHEGYAVILEEVDELKKLVWQYSSNNSGLFIKAQMREECLHIAAMALSFILELTN
jgi:hypothetical protein